MTTQYTPILKLALPTTGELAGTWGDVVNDNITAMVEQAITGRADISTWTSNSHTLTSANGTTSESRCAMLDLSGTLSATGTLTIPASFTKLYIVRNGTTGGYAVNVGMISGTSVSVPNGKTMIVYVDGTNTKEVVTNINSLSVGGYALTLANTFTTAGANALTLTTTGSTNVTLPTTGTLSTLDGNETLTHKTLTSPTISGGTIDNAVIGGTTRAAGNFTTLDANGNVVLGDASSDTVTINGTIQPGAVISGSSTSNALTITQTGTGNALVVEDSTSPDSTPVVINQNGSLIIGNTTAMPSGENWPLQVQGLSSTGVGLSRFSADTAPPVVSFVKSRNTTAGAYGGAVLANDGLGTVFFGGDDGTGRVYGASISAFVDGTPGTNDMPGRLVFSTTKDGASSGTEAMRIRSDQTVVVGANAGADINLKAGVAGTTGSINWTFNTDTTVYGSLSLAYDTRTTTGLKLESAASYPITINSGNGTVFQEDGVEKFRIDSSGRVLKGTDTALSFSLPNWTTTTTQYVLDTQIVGNGFASASQVIANYNTGTTMSSGAGLLFAKSQSGTPGTYGIITAADVPLGTVTGAGDDGAKFLNAAEISFRTDGVPALDSMPGKMVFKTTASGGTVPSTRMEIDSNGAVSIGSAGAQVSGYDLQVTNTDGASIVAQRYAGATVGGSFIRMDKSRGATVGARAAVVANDILGTLEYRGDDATNFVIGAQIRAEVDGTPGTNDMPTRLVFATTADAASTPTTRLTIDSDGQVSIPANNASAALTITQTGAGNALVVEDSASPDSTPFVIDASGKAIAGYTASLTSAGSLSPQIQSVVAGQNAGVLASSWVASTGAGSVVFNKSRSETIGTNAVVLSGDDLGSVRWDGDDGTNFVRAAQISAQVDGTPGTNDMPGRLVFSTTSDGASSVTERMRLNSAGQFLVGVASASSRKNYFAGTMLSGVDSRMFEVNGTLDATNTSVARGIFSTLTTPNTGTTFANVAQFNCSGITKGATDTVTNLIGFSVESGLTNGTNNFGFYSGIASGTGRWNFYAAGTAANYFAGQTLVGNATSTDASVNLLVSSATGSATPTPTEVRIATTSSASDWSTSLPWGRLSFYSGDGSAGGPKIHAAIDAVSFTTAGGTADLSFKTSTNASDALTERMRIRNSGTTPYDAYLSMENNTGLQIARTVVTAPAATDGNVFSGYYTPTQVSTNTNITSVTFTAQCVYMRVGDVVTVGGQISATATTANTATIVKFSLPIASNFGSSSQLAGAGASATATYGGGGAAMLADTINDCVEMRFTPTSTIALIWNFSFTYRIV